jgi:tetratricopeptide (TPR) repeat protein
LERPPLIAKALLALAGAAAGLAAVFAADRLPLGRPPEAHGYAARLEFLFDASGPFFRLVEKDGEKRFVQVPTSSAFAPSGRSFPAAKREGTTRIVVVGESSALTLAHWLESLARRGPYASRVEVVNCGIAGTALETVEKVFGEAAELSPDVVVVFFGNNLMVEQPVLRDGFKRFRRLTRHSRLLRSLAVRPPPGGDKFAAWQRFLRKAARLSRERGFKLVVSTVQGNLMWPPAGRPEDARDERFLAAVHDHYAGRPAEAVRRLTALLRTKRSALWAFRLGDWLRELGRPAEARTYLRMSSDLDVFPRAKSGFNASTRRLAAEEGVVLFDEAAWVLSRAPDGLPGWEIFSDYCHLTPPFFEKAAFALLELLQAEGLLDPAPGWTPAFHAVEGEDRRDFFRDLAETGPEALTGKLLSDARRGRPVDPREIERELESFPGPAAQKSAAARAAAETYFRLGWTEEAFRANRRAAELAPGDPAPHVQRALFALKRDPRDACRHLARAIEIGPEDPQARYFAGRSGCGGPRVSTEK